jgi:beta-glucanase (GH16 family)
MATPARLLAISVTALLALLAVPQPASARIPFPHRHPSPTPTSPTPTPTPTTSTPTPTPTTTTPTPTPTTTSPAPSGACGGEVATKPSGDPWTCTFDDEFDGTTLDTTKWTTVTTSKTGYHSGPECFVDSTNNVSQANGVLSLTVRQESAPFVCVSSSGTNYNTQYTSGSVTTANKFTQTYGRFEVNAAFPATAVAGLQSALWLYPANAVKYGVWPWSGEIDFAEEYSKYADRVIPYIHYVPNILDLHVTNNYCTINNVSAFHNYVVEWTPSTITVTFDGKTCTTDSWSPLSLLKPAPFDQPFFLSLTQALGIGTNAFSPTATPLPATTKVDYVRIWS